MRKITGIIGGLLCLMMLIVIGSAWAEEKISIAFVTNGPYEFWTYSHAGCLKAEKDFGVKVEFFKAPSAQAEEQKRFIETQLAKGVDGVAISVIDPDNQTPFMNEIASQIPVIMFDSDAPKSNRKAYVGMSNYAAGRIAGKAIQHELPNGGDLVIFVGRLDAQNAIERRQGIIDELQGKPYQAQYPGKMSPDKKINCGKWTIVATKTDGGDESRAKANVEDIIAKYPNMDLMIGLWAYNTPAIITALKDAGKLGKMKIVGFDEDPVVLQAIKNGYVYATIVQNPFEYGRKSVEVLVNLIRGQNAGIPANQLVDVPARLITADKVDTFWKDLKKQLSIGRDAEK